MKISNFILLLLLLFIWVGNGFAEELSYKFLRNYYTYSINADGSYILLVESAAKLLTKDALEGFRQRTIAYSTSAERFEVIKAYTEKADGKRIAVPESTLQYPMSRIGKVCAASEWWNGNSCRGITEPLSSVTSSVPLQPKPNRLLKPYADIGESRILCIGDWTWCSVTMPAEFVKEMVLQL